MLNKALIVEDSPLRWKIYVALFSAYPYCELVHVVNCLE